jgi:hypothetical protein
LFNLDFVWVTLEYGLIFLNCYEWCKFPFTQWSVDIILSKEPVFYFFHTRELYSVRCKKCKHTRQKKIMIFRGKEKNPLFLHSSPTDFIPDLKSWPLININVIFNHISIIFIGLIEEKRSFPSMYNCLGLWKKITIISLGFLYIPRSGKLEFLRVCSSTDHWVIHYLFCK